MGKKNNNLERVSFDLNVSEKNSVEYIIGLDEVGYGCFAGPLIVGAVMVSVQGFLKKIDDVIKDFPTISKVKDSKKLSEKLRHKINSDILKISEENQFIKIAIGEASVEEINEHGMTFAHNLATERALKLLSQDNKNSIIILDGNKLDECLKERKVSTFIKGDNLSFTIGCASIVAKEYRDNLMTILSLKHPGYLFEKNKGYGTKEHRDSIVKQGLSPVHRIQYCQNTINQESKDKENLA